MAHTTVYYLVPTCFAFQYGNPVANDLFKDIISKIFVLYSFLWKYAFRFIRKFHETDSVKFACLKLQELIHVPFEYQLLLENDFCNT